MQALIIVFSYKPIFRLAFLKVENKKYDFQPFMFVKHFILHPTILHTVTKV
jgi:hypothetical protein